MSKKMSIDNKMKDSIKNISTPVYSEETFDVTYKEKSEFEKQIEKIAAEVNTDNDPNTGKPFIFGLMYVDQQGNFRYAFNENDRAKCIEIVELTKFQLLNSYVKK